MTWHCLPIQLSVVLAAGPVCKILHYHSLCGLHSIYICELQLCIQLTDKQEKFRAWLADKHCSSFQRRHQWIADSHVEIMLAVNLYLTPKVNTPLFVTNANPLQLIILPEQKFWPLIWNLFTHMHTLTSTCMQPHTPSFLVSYENLDINYDVRNISLA